MPPCARSSRRWPRSIARPALRVSGPLPSGCMRVCAAIDGVQTRLEDEPSWGAFPPTSTGLGLLGMAGAALALGSRRWLGALLAAVSCAGIIDEAQNGPRLILRRRRAAAARTVNVVARVGERDPAAQGEDRIDTLVVLAHHDAPQTGFMFDQTLQRRLHELAPRLIERMKTPRRSGGSGLPGRCARSLRPPAAAADRRGQGSRSVYSAGAIVDRRMAQSDRARRQRQPLRRRRARGPSRAAARAPRAGQCACCSCPVARRRRCRTGYARSLTATVMS